MNEGNKRLESPSLENYPGEDTIPMKIITFQLMIDAITKSHKLIVNGEWPLKVAKSYLYANGINQESRIEIVQNAENCRLLYLGDKNKHRDLLTFNELSALKLSNPEKFLPWPVPPHFIRGAQLRNFVDVLMHLVFLGVARVCCMMIETWLTKNRKHREFILHVQGRLKTIQELDIEWCQMLPYKKGTFDGWVAEQFLAISRLLPWFFLT